MNQEQPIIVGLDIGTTKIAAIAGLTQRLKQNEQDGCSLRAWRPL